MSASPASNTKDLRPMPHAGDTDALERETVVRVAWRLLPLLILGYFCNYLDRVNVGFASLTMNKALGLSGAQYGFGAGVFFVGYLLFEIPSNLIMSRVGARRWIARILLTWGLVSGLTAFVWNDWSFYSVRFLLGLAEAGFYPGMVVYLTWWFPSAYRSRMVAIFMAAQTMSLIVGPFLSAWLLTLDGLFGLQGWQIMFIVEAVPPVIMSVVVWLLLTDRPIDAKWLRPEQRQWLQARLDFENEHRESVRKYSLMATLKEPKVWFFTIVYFGYTSANIVVAFFLPQMVRALGVSLQMTALVSAVPFMFGLLAMLFFSLRSDRSGRRTLYAVSSLVAASAGLAICSLVGADNTIIIMIALVVGVMGVQSFAPLFWSIPTAMLSGVAAAAGIALINSVGNISGLAAPWIFGLIKDATGRDQIALLVISAAPLISAVVLALLGHDRRLEQISSSRLLKKGG